MDRRYTHTYRCTGTRADRHQCRRAVTAFSDDSDVSAEQVARDHAVLAGWSVVGDDWELAELRGLRCPLHA
jgi:hypothetical protein